MSIRSDYEDLLKKHKKMEETHLGHWFLDQEKRWVEPFRLYGDIWYVGDSWVCVHLIDTGDGLLLIDSGNLGAEAMLIDAIWRTGHDPADVKWIIHSHGHLDHIGAANYFKNRFGTKLLLGEPDARNFRERPELALCQDAQNAAFYLFTPDQEIHDGEVIRFGNLDIHFYLNPGHTDGVISLFFDMAENGVTRRCGYYGGFGFNTLQKDYLLEIGDTDFSMRRTYLNSLAKVRGEKVDVFLGNHCINNNMLEKREMQKKDPGSPNPFIDPELWGKYLDQKRDELLAFMADPKNN